jgi:hypothetical protein
LKARAVSGPTPLSVAPVAVSTEWVTFAQELCSEI